MYLFRQFVHLDQHIENRARRQMAKMKINYGSKQTAT